MVLRCMMLSILVVVTSAHDWGLGTCPRVDPIPNLAVEKFLGVWYVIEQFDTGSRCLLLNYTRESETQLRVTKLRQFHILDQVGVDHTNSYSGTLDMPHADDLARMRVKWPLNIAGKGDYIVFDTDYTTYAGIYECQTITSLMHRKSAAILSRAPTLAQEFVDRVKRRLTTFGIDTDDFDKISHEGCRSREDADINIHVDSDTFKNVMSGTRTGLEDAASSLANGFRDFAGTVTQAGQNVFGSTSSSPDSAVPTITVETVKGNVEKDFNTGLESNQKDLKTGVDATKETFGKDAGTGTETFQKDVKTGVGAADKGLNSGFDVTEKTLDAAVDEATVDMKEAVSSTTDSTFNDNTNDLQPADGIIRTVVSVK